MDLFSTLGFHWDRAAANEYLPIHSIERVTFRYHRMLPEVVWDACVVEGLPFSFTEVKTLCDGVTVGGKRISDHQQVQNLAESSRYLLQTVRAAKFTLNKANFTGLHGLAARNGVPLPGRFRGEGQGAGVDLTEALNNRFENGVNALQTAVQQPFERAVAFFLFGALQRFFPDCNMRTSLLMMNGILMAEGVDAISVPGARAREFSDNMLQFYEHEDASEMMAFLRDCHPKSDRSGEVAPNVNAG